jgi:hypothetical protein
MGGRIPRRLSYIITGANHRSVTHDDRADRNFSDLLGPLCLPDCFGHPQLIVGQANVPLSFSREHAFVVNMLCTILWITTSLSTELFTFCSFLWV